MKKTIPFFSVVLLTILLSVSVPLASAQLSAETKKMAADYRDQGLKAQKNGDLDTALIYFQKAVELDPSLAVGYNDLGVIYEAKGMNDRAKQAYGKAIDLDPALAGPYYNMGSIYEKEGDLDKAAYYFKKRVLIGDWNDEWTAKARQELRGLGVSDPEIQEDFLDEHLASLEASAAISGDPKGNDLDPKKRKREAQMRLFRGKQLYYRGLYVEALTELSVASVLDPKNKEVQKTLEEVHRKTLTN